MLKVSRRDFVHGGYATALGTLFSNPLGGTAWAGSGGSGSPKTTINLDIAGQDLFLNLAKNIAFAPQETPAFYGFLDANQMPQGTIRLGNIQCNFDWPSTYYDDFVWKWTGNAQMQLSPAMLLYSISPAGAVKGINGSSGATVGNTMIQISATNPRVVAAFGVLVTSTANNGGLQELGFTTNMLGNLPFSPQSALAISSISGNGTIAILRTAAPHGLPIGLKIQANIADASPSSFNAKAVSITVTGPDTISYFNTTTGQATMPGTLALVAGKMQFRKVAGVTPGSDHIVYKVDNSRAVLANVPVGAATFVTSGGVGAQSEMRYSVGVITTNLGTDAGRFAWSNLVMCRVADESTVDAGAFQITQLAIDSLKALNPEYVRFMDATVSNSGISTSFAGRAIKTQVGYPATRIEPTFWAGQMTRGADDGYTCANPSASRTGPYIEGETVQGYATVTNSSTCPSLALKGRPGGAKPIFAAACFPLNMSISGSPTVGDIIKITLTGSYISGSRYTFSYTVQSSDTSIEALAAHLTAALQNDKTLLAANIRIRNGGSGALQILYNRNAGGNAGGRANGVPIGGGTSFTTDVSGARTELFSLGTLFPNRISTDVPQSYSYSKLLDGWVQSALIAGMPYEICAEICNRVGCGYWHNMPLLYTTASATAFGRLLADRSVLKAGLPIVCELSNEIWNFGFNQTFQAGMLAIQLGMTNGLNSYHDFYGLRFIQLVAKAFVSGYMSQGGSRANLQLTMANTVLEGNGGYSNLMHPRQWNGSALTTSGNSFYAALGGSDGTSATANYDAAPSRPIDFADATSYAIYFMGALIKETASNSFFGGRGEQSLYNSMFQASADFASGNPSRVASALSAWASDIVAGKRGWTTPGSSCLASFFGWGQAVPGWQKKVASYDSQRSGFATPAVTAPLNVLLYEGGLQQGLSDNAVNGSNFSDASALASQFDSQGYALSPTYGADNKAVAQNTVNLLRAFRNSSECRHMVKTNYCKAVVSSHPGRSALPAWYGYSEIPPKTWSLYPAGLASTPYATYFGLADFGAA